jgi:hypothetical protein
MSLRAAGGVLLIVLNTISIFLLSSLNFQFERTTRLFRIQESRSREIVVREAESRRRDFSRFYWDRNDFLYEFLGSRPCHVCRHSRVRGSDRISRSLLSEKLLLAFQQSTYYTTRAVGRDMELSIPQCARLFYSILFYSILFYSILFYSILFYSIQE